MDFGFTKEDEAFRQEVREWLRKEIPPRWYELNPGLWEESDEIWSVYCQYNRKLAEKRWFAPAFPLEYGGMDATFMQQLILAEEKALARAPITIAEAVSTQMVGPTILLYGDEEQKKKYLTAIGAAELVFCLGYTEPGAGSDLAAVQTRATEDGDDFVINGQKIFTTFAHRADYIWLAARTDPDVPKHRGISMFIVDMKTPGITVRPLINILGFHSFNEVFFDDVRVPKTALVGEKNRGWYYLMTALNFERSGIGGPASLRVLLQWLVKYAKETPGDGGVLADDPVIQQKLAEMATEIAVSRVLSLRVADLQCRGLIPSYEVSVAMVCGSELLRRFAKTAGEILGLYGQLRKDPKWEPLMGQIQHSYLAMIPVGIGAGASEIQRNIIAILGLGLPRG